MVPSRLVNGSPASLGHVLAGTPTATYRANSWRPPDVALLTSRQEPRRVGQMWRSERKSCSDELGAPLLWRLLFCNSVVSRSAAGHRTRS